MATYGGLGLGVAVHVQALEVEGCAYRTAYFGVDGTTSLYGGSRGWIFHVDGVLWGATPAALLAFEAAVRALPRGVGSILADDVGREWANVIFLGEYVPSAEGPKYTDTGVCLPYTATFYGLI